MSSATKNQIHYSDNDWNDIVTKYNLNINIDVVLEKQATLPNSEALNSKVSSPWVFRSFALTAIIAMFGNVPLQSHLTVANNNTKVQTFEITPKLEVVTSSSTAPIETLEIAEESSETDTSLFGSHELALPKRAIETYVGEIDKDTSEKWTTYQVKSYDNLTNIFYKLGHQPSLKTLEKYDGIKKELALLKKGSILRASSVEGELSELVFTHNKKDSYVITLNDDKYTGAWEKDVFEIRQSRASFTIKNGLFFDGRKSGIANHILKQVVKVFDWDIDFSHDVRVGDKVTAVFEEIYHDGDKVGEQHLLAAEFVNKGREFKAIRYTYEDGKSDYFTPQGREMKKAFIRTPIEHGRVSSHFNPGRFHPKLHKIRAHKGTDFSGRTGTPIMATGNGTIKSLGRKGGYGRTIVLQHKEGYTTLYAHMSKYKKNLKVGTKVYQGDVIGYVGSSGLATGPHLHYEFRLNGKAIDPMRAALPNSMSLSSNELKDFRSKAINLVLQLNILHRFVEAEIKINSAIGG